VVVDTDYLIIARNSVYFYQHFFNSTCHANPTMFFLPYYNIQTLRYYYYICTNQILTDIITKCSDCIEYLFIII